MSTPAPSHSTEIPGAFRDQFIIPTNREIGAGRIAGEEDKPCTYLCGNSLGPLSRRSQRLVEEELRVWGSRAVQGHFSHPHARPWVGIASHVTPLFAELTGSREKEVACMGTLTANLHLLMLRFYEPTDVRHKILCEANVFPSDRFAFMSQVRMRGFNASGSIIEIHPRSGEYTLRSEDILDVLAKEGQKIALVLLSGVQFYTGQWFDMELITRHAKAQGCIVGWDLAHAIGNVPLSLHDWNVDFAVWCSYKYLNSGPGGIAGLFVHERWNDKEPPLRGWWGYDLSTRFDMACPSSPIPGAQGYQQSNPSVLSTAALLGSLEVFHEAGMMGPLRQASVALTGRLAARLVQSKYFVSLAEAHSRYGARSGGDHGHDDYGGRTIVRFTIITPSDPRSRGAQLSLMFFPHGTGATRKVHAGLLNRGVLGDEREPDVIRLAPAPLFNTFEDCEEAARRLEETLDSLNLDE